MGDPATTTIVSNDRTSLLLDCTGFVCLENMTVDASSVRIALSMRDGRVVLRNCRVIGGSSHNTGFLVTSYCHLEAEDCEFVNLETGVALEAGAEATLTRCTISSCGTAVVVRITNTIDKLYS